MKHQYMINKWFDGDTSCIYRTSSREAWVNEIRNVLKRYNVNEKYARVIVYNDLTIFSFATSKGINSWRETRILATPLYIKYGIPKEVKAEE